MHNSIKILAKIKFLALLAIILMGFSPLISLAYSPYISTGNPTGITANSATLNASVNTNNLPTSVWFEYSKNPSLNNPISITAKRATSGKSANWTANISGLTTNTSYYYRAVAQNGDGRAYGNIYSFTTGHSINYGYSAGNPSLPLSATTESASSVSNTSAQINSLITNGEDGFATAWFEWGTSASLGNKTKTVSVEPLQSLRHANTMKGLAPGTTYYFRAVVENSAWKNSGSILSFTTSGVDGSAIVSVNTEDTNVGSKVVESGDESLRAKSQSANAIDSAPFIPRSVLGWASLVIFILILILLSKHLYREFSKPTPEHPQTPAH